MTNDSLPCNDVQIDPRVPLALERTFLAWIRTALAMMGFGFVVARFGLFLRELGRIPGGSVPRANGISPLMGTALVGLGVIAAIWAAFRYRRGIAAIAVGESPADHVAAVPTLLAFILSAIGVATIWYFLMMA